MKKEKPIYLVINNIDSDHDKKYYKVGSSKDPNKASKILSDDFIREFENAGYSEEDFENDVGRNDTWDLSATFAWIIGKNGTCYDWIIFEVYSEENSD